MKIVVVGSLNCDLVSRVARAPAPGETVFATSFHTFVGGKGCNQAIAAARAAAPGIGVAMVGRVGRDGFARDLFAKLDVAGVDRSQVLADAASVTGVATITVDEAGQNSIVVAPNANATLTPSAVEDARAALAIATVVLLQLEIPIAAAIRAAAIGREAGARVLLVPAPAPVHLPDELMSLVDVLVPNEIEARSLAAVAATATPEAAAETLRRRGVGAVIVTLGGDGALVVDDAGTCHVPAPRVDVVDTTGAGDAFAGALSAELARGGDLRDATRFAVAAGSLACQVLGAEPSLPRREDILAAIV